MKIRPGLKTVAFGAFVAYLLIELAVVVLQRSLVYAPSPIASAAPPNGIAQLINFQSEDGVPLTGWWVATQGSAATLLYCHGNGANLAKLAHVAKLFRDFGLNAFLFDYRGYGASGLGELTEESVARDARAAYDWVLAHQAPEEKIVVWGHSLGAAIASRLANERHPAALITEGAFNSIYGMARWRYPWLLISEALLFDRFNVEEQLAKRTMPLLMLHAENDTVVPVSLGLQAFSLANQPKQWRLIAGINHNDFPSVAELYRAEIMGFIHGAISAPSKVGS
jgi:alpha-beta hydrolase superfamily lysophospholipase